MKRRTTVFLALLAMLMMVFPVPANAKKPLTGTMDLQFNLGWTAPSEVVPDWVGTITIDGDEFGMAFFNTGSGKPFADNPSDVVFFEETWVIYETLSFEFNEVDGTLDTFVPGAVALSGYDVGIVTPANSKYHMNGDVRETNDAFSMWMDRSVHMKGQIEWYPFGAPQFAPGTFRIN